MYNPFTVKDDRYDDKLIEKALSGNKKSFEEIIKNHQRWIYNICLRMVYNHDNAEDITQEILIKIITKLSSFDKSKGNFRTWIYRIALNHILNVKKRVIEKEILGFDYFGKVIDNTPMEPLTYSREFSAEEKILIEETKLGCMNALLMCFDRKQRVVFILGDIFNVNSTVGSKILDISRENYRKILSRARKQLKIFLENKCGMVNKGNTCRCDRKIKSQIKAGKIDPNNMQFYKEFTEKVKDVVNDKKEEMNDLFHVDYFKVYKEQAYYKLILLEI